MTDAIDAQLALRRDGRLLLGRDRVALVEAVAATGSIAAAAKQLGLSYKTAWEGIDAVNNLLPTPAVETRLGGKGGATLTEEGRRLITAFQDLESRLRRVSSLLAGEGLGDQEAELVWALGLRTSARNAFRAEIVDVKRGAVDVDLTLAISPTQRLCVTVTNSAADDLSLTAGRKVLALVKAQHVRVGRNAASNAPNCFDGVLISRVDDAKGVELRIRLADGKTLVSVTPAKRSLPIAVIGDNVTASFESRDVLLLS
jgi:molybdate transport system regulatory protein